MTGTSQAAPQVSSLAAFLWTIRPDLSSDQVVSRIIKNAKPMNDGHKPVIDAYATILSADSIIADQYGYPQFSNPQALTLNTGAPARIAILDLDNSGVFDANDLQAFLKVLSGASPPNKDWSRYDLNGDGITGGSNTYQFNLNSDYMADGVTPNYENWVFIPNLIYKNSTVTFNENQVTDMQVLCYYANSPLMNPNDQASTSGQNLINQACNGLIVDATTGSNGTGTVTSSPTGITCSTVTNQTPANQYCADDYPLNTTVTLTATPASGSNISGWTVTGATNYNCPPPGSYSTPPTKCVVTMNGQPVSVVATFSTTCQFGSPGPAGGVIFYCDSTGSHGLEAAPVDQTPSTWGCWGWNPNAGSFTQTILGGTDNGGEVYNNQDIYGGAANTSAIIAACGTSGGAGNGNPYGLGTQDNAAATAAAYTLNGYTDWYLPDDTELVMLSELTESEFTKGSQYAASFTYPTHCYWSSTFFIYTPNPRTAYDNLTPIPSGINPNCTSLTNQNIPGNPDDIQIYNTQGVRAVRAF
jgi:hypothetical protein